MRTPLTSLEGQTFDTAVIGGGAAGASAAQHLAAKGFRTLLIDKGDFASGTTSRSSRLLYCGLAYFSPDYALWRFAYRWGDLKNRIAMARLAMQCRTQLAVTMPERLSRHTFFFPVFRDGAFPAWKVDLGYRALSLFGSPQAPLGYHRLPGAKAAEQYGLVRLMDQRRLDSVGVFQEYQYKWAERICLDTVLDAERCGAAVRNYTRVAAIEPLADKRWRLTLEDTLAKGVTARIEANGLVNTAGPWADRVTAQVVPHPKPRLVGIKGVNVMVKLPDDCRGLGMETISSIGQPFYCMPWGDYHFFGPTETIFEDDPDAVRVLPEELSFILGEANRVFPSLKLTTEDVIYSWCGVRPRTTSDGDEGVKSVKIHDLAEEGMPNALALTGTPIMVHRHAGRKIAERMAGMLRPSGTPRPLSYGAKLPPANDAPGASIPVEALRHAAAHEHAATLTDLMFRRVMIGWNPGMGVSEARAAAEAVADVLGWDDARITAEVDAYLAFIAEHFAPAALRTRRAAVA
ncbi:FAD-dependent oxidoreductase [Rhodoligotrophos defluvii]|uniref:FAD-dependent oxidoreductase n=1 Tax=Rhodoligotrophos defluvii TaxID=2561934 RepID=UPI0010C9B59F|nr:FAD-dependent oxidoreductase [Rhodoligotrophos defluvii]